MARAKRLRTHRASRRTTALLGIVVSLLLARPSVAQGAARRSAVITAHLTACDSFRQPFGPGFVLELRPQQDARRCDGWSVVVLRSGSDVNLAGMTPPWHGPGPLDIAAWHFLPSVNAPGRHREFMFSPEVGTTITWDLVDPRSPEPSNLERTMTLLKRVEDFGHGEIDIVKYEMNGATVEDAEFLSIDLTARLSWPASYRPR